MTAVSARGAASVRRWSSRARLLGSMRLPPRRLATTILVLVIAGYGVLAIVGVVFQSQSAADGLVSAGFVLALVSLQLGYLSRPDLRPRPPWSYLALLAQAALVFLPIGLFGPVWHGFPGFLAGSALIVLPLVAGLPVAVLVVAALVVVSLAGAPDVGQTDLVLLAAYVITSTVTSAIAVYGLSTLVRLVVEAQIAREELSRAAVDRERVRFAENVHDLLGHGLSAITLRCELVSRLALTQTDRARAELVDVLALSRQAASDVRTVAGVSRDLPGSDGAAASGGASPVPATYLAPRLARSMLGVVLLDFGVITVVGVLQDRGAVPGVQSAVVVAAILLLIMGYLSRPGPPPGPVGSGIGLAVLAVLIYVPMFYFGPSWHGLPEFLGGTALVVLPTVPGVAVAVLAAASAVAIELTNPSSTTGSVLHSVTYIGVGVVIVILTIYGLSTVARLVVEVHAARDELSRLAVAQQRMRFARDVHDLLGLSLSVITLKCELTGRLLGGQPDLARAELSEVLAAARRALADVRTVTGGNRELSLPDEVLLAARTLSDAGVDVRLRQSAPAPEGPVGTVLAMVLREGATNVLRHSNAVWCEISLGRSSGEVTLEIVNDGVGLDERAPDPDGGNGLRNMLYRVNALGGSMSGATHGATYRLGASVPLAVPPPRAYPPSRKRRTSAPLGVTG